MKIRFFNPGLGYRKIKPDIDDAIHRVLDRGDLVLREDVEQFEENLARYVGTKYAVALNSGTDALYLALKALDVKGEPVAVPSHTFKSTCGAVINAGGIPELYDKTELFFGTQYYITAHIAGEIYPVPSDERIVVEDAAQALGAIKNPTTYAQTWSFYPAKILGAYGDAGAITTNDFTLYEYAKEARNHFKKYNSEFGINSRMDNVQAAVLNVKFRYLPEYLLRRKEIAEKYRALKGVILPDYSEKRVWQDYIIRTEKRDELFEFLKERGVETMKNEYPFTPNYPKLPAAAAYEAQTLRIPCNPDLTGEEVEYIIHSINEWSESSVAAV